MSEPATLITGASSGIGAAFARACGKRGDKVILVARRADRLQALALEIGNRAQVLVADLTESEARADLPRRVAAAGLHVDILVNNAGFGLIGRFAQLPGDRQIEMIELNVAALTDLSHRFLPGMLERGRGGILNVASTAAFQAGPGFGVYFATKAFVLSLSEAMHQELKGTGVAVCALCPGPVSTEFGAVAGSGSGDLPFKGLHADADSVAAAGLQGLARNKAVVIPGVANKLTAQSNRLLPRALMRRIVASLKL